MKKEIDNFIAGIVGTFSIVIFFIIIFMVYAVLLDSPLANNPTSKAILEQGQEATQNTFTLWSIADEIGGIILFGLMVFGIVMAIIKIVENNNTSNFAGGHY